MTVKLPLARPEEPSPAIARPAMNMAEELTTAHTNEPISKMKRKNMYTHWGRPSKKEREKKECQFSGLPLSFCLRLDRAGSI